LSRGIPTGDGPLHIGADNAVLRTLDDILKQESRLLRAIRKESVPVVF
jgi:citrate synthase